jgi:hypothetical protein
VADPPPARFRVRDQTHLPEVDLEFDARFAVGYPHRRAPGRPPHPDDLQGVTVQRALRHRHPPPGEELMRLHHRQAFLLQPRRDLVVVGRQHRPGSAVAVVAMRAHPLTHRRQEHVGELLLAAVPDQAALLGGDHVAAGRLAVHRPQPLDRAEPLTPQPQPQDLTDLEHANLPECHRHLPGPLDGQVTTPPSATPSLVDPQVVP